MHFLPTDDQRELQRGVRDVLAGAFPLEALPGGWTPVLWRTLADTGVFTLRSDLGAGLAEAALVYEELGRAAVQRPGMTADYGETSAISPRSSMRCGH